MEVFALIGFAIIIGVFVGLVMGIVAFNQVRALAVDVDNLRKQVAALSGTLLSSATVTSVRFGDAEPASQLSSARSAPAEPVIDKLDLDLDDSAPYQPAAITPNEDAAAQIVADERARHTTDADTHPSQTAVETSAFWEQLQAQWMVWLGGACVGLAGIFLAKYSIEQGLLGPTARIVSGVLTGLGLHVAALWLRAKQGDHPSFAALAGGGSITLFAAFLAALHFYQMFSPMTVFVCLAVVALLTLWMALLHGPVLAAIGMIGAYSVPLLVSTGSGNIVAAMVYALVISASVLWLLRYVYRPWLWWGLMAGGLLWWAISLTGHQADGLRGWYLAIFAYGLIAVVPSNWLLMFKVTGALWPFESNLEKAKDTSLLPVSLLLVLAANTVSLWQFGWQGQWLNWSVLPALLLWTCSFQGRLSVLPWLAFLGQWLAIFSTQLHERQGQLGVDSLSLENQPALLLYSLMTVGLYGFFALRNIKESSAPNWWASLLTMVPVLSLLLCYCLATSYTSDWRWALLAVSMGAIYIWLGAVSSAKAWHKALQVWLLLAGHFAYSLAAAWVLDEASLTLAMAVQVISIGWIIKRFEVPELGWLLKAVVVLVVVRLTLNPWLADYSYETHWSLWTYGGATLCCVLGTHFLRVYPALARWTEAAALHLFVLTVWSEARYWLHDGNAFSQRFEFVEAVLNSLLFSALALVYHYKAKISVNLAAWYQFYGRLQLGFALLNYLVIVLAILASNSWAWASVSSRPIINLALLALGGPIVMAVLVARFYEPAFKKTALWVAAFAAFFFITFEIRHLWQGSLSLGHAVKAGEMYTYSVVWLVCAVVALLAGSWRFGKSVYRAGMALLAVVIVKIFLVDLADLEGLWRVASFMGLGLALLGVAFLHQKIQQAAR
ncbi:DUF2339 domain-containing protein [Simiduia litorea]